MIYSAQNGVEYYIHEDRDCCEGLGLERYLHVMRASYRACVCIIYHIAYFSSYLSFLLGVSVLLEGRAEYKSTRSFQDVDNGTRNRLSYVNCKSLGAYFL